MTSTSRSLRHHCAKVLLLAGLSGALSCGPQFLAVLLTVSGMPKDTDKLLVTTRLNGVMKEHGPYTTNQRTIGFELTAGTSGILLIDVDARDKNGCTLSKETTEVQLSENRLYNKELMLNASGTCGGPKPPDPPPPDPTKAQLSGLAVSRGTLSPAFAPGSTMYEVSVPSWITAFVLLPTAPAGVTIKVGGQEVASGGPALPVSLIVGANEIGIETSAPAKAPTSYAIKIMRGTTPSIYFKAAMTGMNHKLGDSVALDGNYLAVGAPGVSGNEGAAYVFEWSGTAWVEKAMLKSSSVSTTESFGATMALSGDTLVVGASLEDGTNTDSGAAYVYRRSAGGAWSFSQKLKASNASMNAQFGRALAIKGDRLAIGAHRSHNGDGGVYIFERSGGMFEPKKILPGTGGSGEQLGYSVSLDADRLATGANNSSKGKLRAGAVYMFKGAGATWDPEGSFITAPNAQDEVNGSDNIEFGSTVSLAGDLLAIGDYYEDGAGTGIGTPGTPTVKDSGAVYLFRRMGTSWVFDTYIKAHNSTSGLRFGATVRLEGDVLLAGTGLENTGGSFSGAAYLFRRAGGKWFQEAFLKSDGDVRELDTFGASIALSGGRVLVGAPNEDSNATGVKTDLPSRNNEALTDSGAAFLFP